MVQFRNLKFASFFFFFFFFFCGELLSYSRIIKPPARPSHSMNLRAHSHRIGGRGSRYRRNVDSVEISCTAYIFHGCRGHAISHPCQTVFVTVEIGVLEIFKARLSKRCSLMHGGAWPVTQHSPICRSLRPIIALEKDLISLFDRYVCSEQHVL